MHVLKLKCRGLQFAGGMNWKKKDVLRFPKPDLSV